MRERGYANLYLRRHDESLQDFSQAVALNPHDADILEGYADSLAHSGDPKQGLNLFHKAIELNPSSAAYTGRGFAYALAEANEEALADFARAIELDPRAATAYAYRAWTYLHQQQAELGLKDVARALKLDPNCAVAFWVRGEIQEAQGHAELAIRHRAPVVPVGIVGAEEQLPQLFSSRRLGKLVGAPAMPVPAVPLPLPVRYHILYGEPLRFDQEFTPADADDPVVVKAAAARVRAAVEALIARGLRERKGVFA